ncbi:DNA polymerase domain-containing protein [Opitutus sp. GAS368]|jgi:DNA polymerase I|uniref:DNA polymerase domain-containing protein n=1 Tax=Opitutus sp. GAS368 TaxID=1882749 RepID=UPI00087CFDF7|nr:DNA polymerase domain-containing protein [Opitutus sp. GAS368]SDS62273.1 DNA polymerase elongation subunit (family B) [Opitutus sp. GAS368]
MTNKASDTLCGLWIDDAGKVHGCYATPGGGREERTEVFKPFAWLAAETPHEGISFERLKGEGTFNWLAHAESLGSFEVFFKAVREGAAIDVLKPYESQWLLQQRARLYADLKFADLRRCQLDIETGAAEAGAFSDAKNPGDRVLAIGLQCGTRRELLTLGEETDAGEKRLLLAFNDMLRELDPDVIEGHNIFKFDLDYLRTRSKRLKVPCAWGRFGLPAEFRNSKMKVAERWIDFSRCDLPGRAVIDTYLMVQLYDITAREMTAYGLKDAAVYFGITPESGEGRTYIDGAEIQHTFRQNREEFLAYLADDLRETRGLADVLLPTYFEQARAFPLLLQEAALRGTAGKVDLLFLEEYYHARASCPAPIDIAPFEGGFTRSFQEGVFKHVLHFDVASLYPSLLLQMGRNPASDTLGVFIPMLRRLREYRLKYKQLAKAAPTAAERDEAQARQATFKILINSFYGYLGFSGARFGDGELAAEVTRRGRELLQALIEEFQKHGCTILEADTDGIYLSTDRYFAKPEELLALVGKILPAGIELEYDGTYDAMFCYKAKNYALAAGGEVTLRGSALRSRGIEPFLKRLGDLLIAYLLGVSEVSPVTEIERLRKTIAAREQPVADLAKAETLSQNPEAYQQWVAGGGKPRRAAAEVALQMNPRPRMGERVSYFIGPKAKGQTSDWQRARPLAAHDAAAAPYDPVYYLGKIDDWLERYGRFLGIKPQPAQQEMTL